MKIEQAQQLLNGTKADAWMKELYGVRGEQNRERYRDAVRQFQKYFGDLDFELFSAPGRSEIGGNHTDHNHGKVLAASIDLDCIAAAAVCEDNTVTVISEGYAPICISLGDLEPGEETTGTEALLRGILAGCLNRGFAIGGLKAYVTSSVISAAGVSSSAAFEMLICTMLDYFFNHGRIGVVGYAHIGKYAENMYWKKQSGLLDQMACAVGGLITIDFANPEDPKVEKVDFSFSQIGCDLVIVNTGKGHGDLSEEYSSIPKEMKQVARCFGKEVLAEITLEEVLENIPRLRQEAGDRPVLRALHFFAENQRVEQEVEAIQNKDYDGFLKLLGQSGNSSWKWLQNCYPNETPHEQAVTVTLALTELFISRIGKGVCRVHGGGFAGVIMAVIPQEYTAEYIEYIEEKIGRGNAYVMNIRKHGAVHLELE